MEFVPIPLWSIPGRLKCQLLGPSLRDKMCLFVNLSEVGLCVTILLNVTGVPKGTLKQRVLRQVNFISDSYT